MGKPKKGPPPPPPEVPHQFHIEGFATVETRETSVVLTPCVVTLSPEKNPDVLAEEELKTFGTLRMHIEQSTEGTPEFQIKLLKPYDSEMKALCNELVEKGKLPLAYELEEHGLPHIKADGWFKEPLAFPVFLSEGKETKSKYSTTNRAGGKCKNHKMSFSEIKAISKSKGNRKSFSTANIKRTKDENITEKKKDFYSLQSSPNPKQTTTLFERQQSIYSRSVEPDIQEATEDEKVNLWIKSSVRTMIELNQSTIQSDCQESRLGTDDQSASEKTIGKYEEDESFRPISKNFTVLQTTVDPVSFANKDKTIYSSKVDNSMDPDPLGYDINAQKQFSNNPFTVQDRVGNVYTIDPSVIEPDANGYYTINDSFAGDVLVIEPPKLVVLDPITERELVIDPRKPVGQLYSALDTLGNCITMDTYDKQPYIYEDPVTGARLLKDESKVKPYTVIDPITGDEVRIDPLKMDGKPYIGTNGEDKKYYIVPVIPGGTPVLFEDPISGVTNVLGGPIEIRDPETGQMQFQQGAFTMRNPKTGQNINQIGPILKKDPKTGNMLLMSNPRYVNHPHTNELTLEPTVVYNIEESGQVVISMPETEKEKAKQFVHGKNMIWDDKLGVFKQPEAKLSRGKVPQVQSTEVFPDSSSEKSVVSKTPVTGKTILNRFTIDIPPLETIMKSMPPKADKRIQKVFDGLVEKHRCIIRNIMMRKKKVERSFLQKNLALKEQKQNTFIHTVIDYFGFRLKNYNKIMFVNHIENRINEENEKLTSIFKEKIKYENNLAVDAILICIEKEKIKLLTACNPKGTKYDYTHILPEVINQDPCDVSELETTNKWFKRALLVYRNFKKTVMNMFEQSEKRENDLILKEMNVCLSKEMAFIKSNMNCLYKKLCCETYMNK